MEYVNCNLCGLDDTQVLFRKKDKFGITEDEFNVVECRGMWTPLYQSQTYPGGDGKVLSRDLFLEGDPGG